MAPKPMWMVRADVGGRLFEDFKTHSLVAVGWTKLGDFSPYKTRVAMSKAVAATYPDMSKAKIAASAGQTYRFANEIQVGDRVMTYDPKERVYRVGTIAGPYQYKPGAAQNFSSMRLVTWQGDVSRDAVSPIARNSLGAISTLFLVPTEVADEIEDLLAGKPSKETELPPETEQKDVDDLFEDMQSKAFEFVKDRVAKLDWEGMQELVAGVLRAMGYKTRISAPGPDRGKDIVASPDGFGFEQPRIVVEVKHRTAAMGSQEIRSFIGGRHKDDKGLYVSTGGFSKDAKYEADRATIPMALMDLDDLVSAVLEYYDRMDDESQRLVPLRKVYWPG